MLLESRIRSRRSTFLPRKHWRREGREILPETKGERNVSCKSPPPVYHILTREEREEGKSERRPLSFLLLLLQPVKKGRGCERRRGRKGDGNRGGFLSREKRVEKRKNPTGFFQKLPLVNDMGLCATRGLFPVGYEKKKGYSSSSTPFLSLLFLPPLLLSLLSSDTVMARAKSLTHR